MSLWDDIKREYDEVCAAIDAWWTKRQGYLDEAENVRLIKKRFVKDKETIESEKSTVSSYFSSAPEYFVGNVYDTVYVPTQSELLDTYQTVIDNLDANIELLKAEIVNFENLAYECDGPIGDLRARANSLWLDLFGWA